MGAVVRIAAAALNPLPNRLMRGTMEVSVCDSALQIGSRQYSGVYPVLREPQLIHRLRNS